MTRLVEIIEHPQIRSDYKLVAEAASKIGSPQLRNTSTVAGNLCQRPRGWYFRHPDIVCLKKGGDKCWAVEGDNPYYHAILEGGPCHIVHPSDLAPPLIALNASIHILGPKGPRSLPLESFFVTTAEKLYQENVLEHSEVITEIRVPRPQPDTRQVFLKSTVRQAGEFSLVAVALAAQVRGGLCAQCRIVMGGVSPRPYRATAAEDAVKGKRLTAETIRKAAQAGLEEAAPMSMNAYKVDLSQGLIERALGQAV